MCIKAKSGMHQYSFLNRTEKYISEHIWLANVIRSIMEIKIKKCL